MKKSLFALGVALVFCYASTGQVHAVPITGKIDFNGAASTNTGDLASATSFTSFTGVTVANAPAPTGNYAGTGGTTVAMSGFTFNPSGGATPLWTFTIGATTYSFNLTSSQVVTQNANFLNVSGIGTAYVTGFDPTPGAFSITLVSSAGGTQASFSFVSETSVPDGGSALALLGIAVTGLEGARRMIRRRKI